MCPGPTVSIPSQTQLTHEDPLTVYGDSGFVQRCIVTPPTPLDFGNIWLGYNTGTEECDPSSAPQCADVDLSLHAIGQCGDVVVAVSPSKATCHWSLPYTHRCAESIAPLPSSRDESNLISWPAPGETDQ